MRREARLIDVVGKDRNVHRHRVPLIVTEAGKVDAVAAVRDVAALRPVAVALVTAAADLLW